MWTGQPAISLEATAYNLLWWDLYQLGSAMCECDVWWKFDWHQEWRSCTTQSFQGKECSCFRLNWITKRHGVLLRVLITAYVCHIPPKLSYHGLEFFNREWVFRENFTFLIWGARALIATLDRENLNVSRKRAAEGLRSYASAWRQYIIEYWTIIINRRAKKGWSLILPSAGGKTANAASVAAAVCSLACTITI